MGLKHATGSGIIFVEKLQMNHFFKYFRNRKELDCLIGPQKTRVTVALRKIEVIAEV